MVLNTYLFVVCSAVYATLSVLISLRARQRTNLLLAISCGITAVWAAVGAMWPRPLLAGPVGFLDLVRLLGWYTYLLYLYRRSAVGSAWHVRGFGTVAVGVFAAGVASAFIPVEPLSYSLFSLPITIRLVICIFELLLIENLYLNLSENTRWHVALPCVLLGGLACFDILMAADTALFRHPSQPLASARAIATIIVAPLLVLAAFRGRRWSEPVRLSRTAVFHSATLVLSGSVLLSLALAGELLRQLDAAWGWVAELSLVFSGLIGLLLFLSSRSARSLMDRVVVHHFFADRYDYRLQWLHCIGTLSGKGDIERSGLQTRAIRAVADVVDSPNGAIFLRENSTDPMVWAGSWNMPASTRFTPLHKVAELLSENAQVVDLREVDAEILQIEPLVHLGPAWLAVPLVHSSGVIGVVVVGPPRVAFTVDQEVSNLLGILGQEVATYIAEQRATEVVLQTRNLHEYGKRFAFVAHDIKNVSSQLALLLRNAEYHLENPDFQQDMLETVRSSVHKIDNLLKRLSEPAADLALASVTPVPRLEALVATYKRVRKASLILQHDGSTGKIAIGQDAFDTAITHLLNNAVEAAPGQSVVVRIDHEAERVVIEIEDHGGGMSPEFVRDELFTPFKTKKTGGSGIGAFQARELINASGGELLVTSQQGVGTTMRIVFARADQIESAPVGRLLLRAVGE